MLRSIAVVDYNPLWPLQFEQLKARLQPVVGPWLSSIEHVGSTSVPGLAAKPVIDLDLVIDSTVVLPAVIAGLTTLGYQHLGDRGVPGREAFQRPAETVAHNLYVCLQGCSALSNHLAIRDTLRSQPALRDAYGQLKKQLAKRFPHDIDAYVDGKTDLLVGILEHVGFSQRWLDEIRGINHLK